MREYNHSIAWYIHAIARAEVTRISALKGIVFRLLKSENEKELEVTLDSAVKTLDGTSLSVTYKRDLKSLLYGIKWVYVNTPESIDDILKEVEHATSFRSLWDYVKTLKKEGFMSYKAFLELKLQKEANKGGSKPPKSKSKGDVNLSPFKSGDIEEDKKIILDVKKISSNSLEEIKKEVMITSKFIVNGIESLTSEELVKLYNVYKELDFI